MSKTLLHGCRGWLVNLCGIFVALFAMPWYDHSQPVAGEEFDDGGYLPPYPRHDEFIWGLPGWFFWQSFLSLVGSFVIQAANVSSNIRAPRVACMQRYQILQ